MDSEERQRFEAAAKAAWDVAGERSRAAGRERISQARTRAIVGVFAGILVATWLAWRGHRVAAVVPGAVAAILFVALVALPAERLVGFTQLVGRFGDLVGRAAAWLFLTPVYVFVVFPFGAFRRARGHDPLDRRGEKRASYWKKHAGRGSSERTF